MSEEVTDVAFKYPGCIPVDLNNKLTSNDTNRLVIDYTISNSVDEGKEPIYELLKPDEIFVLYKDSDGIVYVGNKDGELFIRKLPYKDIVN